MAQNLVIDGTVFNGVNSISMTNDIGEKITYIEKTNVGTGVYVAQIDERRFYTVEDALAAAVSGETVMLIADCVEKANLLVPGGVTLELDGYTLEAPVFATTTGSQVLNSKTSGILKVPQNGMAINNGNTYIPVWNGVDGYYLIRFGWTTQVSKNAQTDSVSYYFLPKPRNGSTDNLEVVRLWQDGASDNQIKIEGHLEWDGADGKHTMILRYDDAVISTVYTGNPTLTGSACFIFTASGVSGFTNAKVNGVIVSDLGPEYGSSKKDAN